MELVGQPSNFGACNLLGVPGLSSLDVDDDEGNIVIGIRPKSSPQPRRRTSVDDEDSEPEPPLCGSRRVSFADAKGLKLVQVKEFDLWDVPKLPGYDASEGEGNDAEEYFLSPLTFSRPLPMEELFGNVREQKVELETLELLPGTSILKGVVRVLNVSFGKAVYIRTSLDSWSSHFDLLAEYVPGSSDGVTDCFSFKLTLVLPFGEQVVRADFCIRYETPLGIFWANNNNRNYALHCYHRKKEEKRRPQMESVNKKSCLKTVSQDFSTVENNSGKEDSSLDNLSTDVSNLEAKTTNICNGQSGTSEEEKQKLLVENRQNSSRRSRRKAARMAQVRTFFAQRNGGITDNERDESPQKVKQVASDESPEEKRKDVQEVSEGEDSEVVESLKRCSEPLVDDTSPALDNIFSSKSVKSESITSLTGCQDNLVHSDKEPAPSEKQNIVTEAEERSQTRDMCYECSNSPAAVSSESLVSHTECFTFETVLAPLYQQVFGRVGSESQSTADWENPVRTTEAIGNLNSLSERQSSCIVPTNTISNQELNHELLDATLNSPDEDDQTNLSVAVNDVEECGPKPLLGGKYGLTQPGSILASNDLLNFQIPPESSNLQEVDQTHDAQSQTTAESLLHQLPEQMCTVNKINEDDTQQVKISQQSSSTSFQPFQTVSGLIIEETGQERSSRGENNFKSEELDQDHDSLSTTKTNISSKEDKMFEMLHDFNSNHTDTPVTKKSEKQSESSLVSGCEPVEQIHFTTPETSLETNGETNDTEEENDLMHSSQKDETKHLSGINIMSGVVEHLTKALMSETDKDGDIMFLGFKDDDKIEHLQIEAVPKQEEDVCFTNFTEVKNWEAMVEEEENNVLISEEDIQTLDLKAEDMEAIQEVSAQERKEEIVEEIVGEITVKEVKEDKTVVLEDEERIGMEEIGHTNVIKELDHVQITEKTVRKLTEDIDVEKTQQFEDKQLEKEKHFLDTEDVFGRTHFKKEHGVEEWREKTDMELDNEGEAGVESEDEVKPKEEKEAKGNPDCNEEMVEAAESEIKDADSWMEVEGGEDVEESFQERLDITQDNIADGALIDREYKEKGQNKHYYPETCLHEEEEEEEFQSNNNVACDTSKAKFTAEDGNLCVLTDEWENDQTSHDSTSTESDSDDEVELYMHCLRAVTTGAQAHKDRSNDAGLTMSKRPSISRSKLLSTPMPSISESLDEDQPLSCLQENQEDLTTAFSAVLTASSGQESINQNTSGWRDIFSWSKISKTLLYTTLLVLFLVVAYHYDFLACLGLYLISAVWLCCQGERQPTKKNRLG